MSLLMNRLQIYAFIPKPPNNRRRNYRFYHKKPWLAVAGQGFDLLFDGDPDGLAFVFGGDDFLLQAVNPDAAVEDFADFAVLAYKDAAFGVF